MTQKITFGRVILVGERKKHISERIIVVVAHGIVYGVVPGRVGDVACCFGGEGGGVGRNHVVKFTDCLFGTW